MIVDFAIEDDDLVTIFTVHRLISERGKINDLQPNSAEGDISRFENPLLVRASMYQALSGSLYATLGNASVFMGKTGNAAQFRVSPRLRRTLKRRREDSCLIAILADSARDSVSSGSAANLATLESFSRWGKCVEGLRQQLRCGQEWHLSN